MPTTRVRRGASVRPELATEDREDLQVTREALGWLFVATCFTATGYALARAVDAWRSLGRGVAVSRGWWDREGE